jgi:hypothetical protein
MSNMNPIHTPHPISLRSISILPYLCLGLANGLLLSGFSTTILYVFLIFPMRATCSAHHILHDLMILVTQHWITYSVTNISCALLKMLNSFSCSQAPHSYEAWSLIIVVTKAQFTSSNSSSLRTVFVFLPHTHTHTRTRTRTHTHTHTRARARVSSGHAFPNPNWSCIFCFLPKSSTNKDGRSVSRTVRSPEMNKGHPIKKVANDSWENRKRRVGVCTYVSIYMYI